MLTGAGGFLASNLMVNPPTIGASCALFGLMGALVVFGRRRGGTFGQNLSNQVLIWAAAGFLISFAIPQVNNAGHLGGFVTGLLLGKLLPLHNQSEGRWVQLAAIGLIGLTVTGFLLSGWSMWWVYTQGVGYCR